MAFFEICPHCGSDDVDGNRRSGRARCAACGFESSSGAPIAVEPRLRPTASPRPDLDPEALPAFLALPWSALTLEQEPRIKLYKAVDVAEVAVRWAVAVALAEVVYAAAGVLPEALAPALREQIERPTLGAWLGILRALSARRPAAPLAPEVFDLSAEVLEPAFPRPGAEGSAADEESSLLALRNLLAHGGGGLSRARAADLLELHGPRVEEVVRRVAAVTDRLKVVAVESGAARLLRGTRSTSCALPAARSTDGVFLVGEERVVPLLPLVAFGLVRVVSRDGQLEPRSTNLFPQMYLRATPRGLAYTPLGGVDFAVSESNAVEAFRALFRLDADRGRAALGRPVAMTFDPEDFLREARLLAEDLVGRKKELDVVRAWLKGRDARASDVARVGWIGGGPGVGKSMVVAALAASAASARPEQQGVYYHRFRAGDARCSRAAFMSLLQAALVAWPPLSALAPPREEAHEGEELERDVVARLGQVAALEATRPRAPRPRFVILADGLDEVAPREPELPTLLLKLATPGVLLVAAGRAEHGLDGLFTGPGCQAVFSEGALPPMCDDDVRAMMMRGLGPARDALLQRDIEAPQGVSNPFVARVVERAEGLPLYVHLLLEDLARGELSLRDEDRLPRGLVAYYDVLLDRLGLSAVRRDLPLIVCLVTRAVEPIDEVGLAILLAGAPDKASRYVDRVRAALCAARTLFRAAPTPEGTVGVAIYHQSFREHVGGRPVDPARASPAKEPCAALAEVVREAEERLVEAADWWAELPPGALRSHLLRHGTRYAIQWGDKGARARAQGRLASPAFLLARSGGAWEGYWGEHVQVLQEYADLRLRVGAPIDAAFWLALIPVLSSHALRCVLDLVFERTGSWTTESGRRVTAITMPPPEACRLLVREPVVVDLVAGLVNDLTYVAGQDPGEHITPPLLLSLISACADEGLVQHLERFRRSIVFLGRYSVDDIALPTPYGVQLRDGTHELPRALYEENAHIVAYELWSHLSAVTPAGTTVAVAAADERPLWAPGAYPCRVCGGEFHHSQAICPQCGASDFPD